MRLDRRRLIRVRSIEGDVSVGADEHSCVAFAEERERPGQPHLLRVVVPEEQLFSTLRDFIGQFELGHGVKHGPRLGECHTVFAHVGCRLQLDLLTLQVKFAADAWAKELHGRRAEVQAHIRMDDGGFAAMEALLDCAIVRATIAVAGVVVVALLVIVTSAVATNCQGTIVLAPRGADHTSPAKLGGAPPRATISRNLVAIVTLL